MNLGDIRLTTRYHTGSIVPAVLGVIHEFGHGLYAHGVSQSLETTPLCAGMSFRLHESQSRLWENLVGRSRAAWTCFLPELKQAFPGQLRHVDVDRFYRANDCAGTKHLHRRGRKFTPRETLQKVTGTDTLDVGPYAAYLRRKFGEIYRLPREPRARA
jgi:Zn-dependent M32 family carboxypeptidase